MWRIFMAQHSINQRWAHPATDGKSSAWQQRIQHDSKAIETLPCRGGARRCQGFGFRTPYKRQGSRRYLSSANANWCSWSRPSQKSIQLHYPQICPFPGHERLPLHLVKRAWESRSIMWNFLWSYGWGSYVTYHLSSTCSSKSAVGQCHDTWLGPKAMKNE